MKKIILSIAIVTVLFSGCEKVLTEDLLENTPQENFDFLWNFANEHYTFFDYKNINWDSVKSVHQQRISPNMSDDSLFAVLADMTKALRDGHSTLWSETHKYVYLDYYLDRPANYNSFVLTKNYLQPNNFERVDPFYIMETDNVGYMNYTSFSLQYTDEQLDYILTKFKDTKGVIVDLRDNTGGDGANIDRLAGKFTDKKVLAGYNQFKTGPGENDYGEKISCYVHPQGNIQYTGKVIVLVNRKVYSSANIATAFFKALPNVTLIGDITGGGGGIPVYTELPNGWIFRCAGSINTMPDGFNIEKGIEPDIYETIESAGEGKDGILERAIMEINR